MTARSARRRSSSSTHCSRATSCSARGKRSSYYLDKYRFETQPELLRQLGVRLADAASEVEPEVVRLAGTSPRSRCTGRFRSYGVRPALHHRAR